MKSGIIDSSQIKIIMHNTSINTFYDQLVDDKVLEPNNFLGHFDIFQWQDVRKDLSACENIQRKQFYKISILDGQATYHSNDNVLQISGKNIVFTDPKTRFSFSTTDPDFNAEYCIFTEGFLRGTNKLSFNNWPVFKDADIYVKSLSDKAHQDLLSILNEIKTEYQSTYPFKEQFILNKVFDLIHYTQKLDFDSDIEIKPAESLDELFFNTLDSEFSNITTTTPLTDKSPSYFAKLLHTTVDRLNVTIKRITGKTTQDLIHERIVVEANIMLRHSSYSIKEIAWCLDFQETSHFINFYKKNTGFTPLTDRNK
jgi:AraC family transcriptional activator of pobA